MQSARVITLAVEIGIYAAFIFGVLLFSGDSIEAVIGAISLRGRLKRRGAVPRQADSNPYLHNLLRTVFKKEVKPAVFLAALLMLFLISFAAGMRLFSAAAAFLAALMVTALPLMLASAKLEGDRTRSSREGAGFVSELYRQYRINNKNIYAAMEKTAESGGDFPICKKYSSRLLMRIRSSGSEDKIKESTDQFAFALGTVWGHMLAVCINLAAARGTDVSEGLADIVAQLGKAKERAEERKRLNSEAARMTVFLIPLLYVGTMLISLFYLDVPVGKLLINQFTTPEGLIFFLFIAFMLALNMLIIRLVTNVRIDY